MMQAVRTLIILAVLGCGLAVQAAEQPYPARAIRIVVPFAPGGGTDTLARIVGQKLSERWGQPVVIENQAGASGGIGTRAVARAEPDGYTLLMASTGALIAASTSLGGDGPFDVERFFSPVTLVAAPPYIVTTSRALGAATIADLVRLARARPGVLTFGSSGIGAASHLAGELFQKTAGVELLHVPYRGTGQAVADLLSGRLDMMFAPPPTVDPLVQSGELAALATTGAVRSHLFPKLPTVAESGLPGYDAVGWFGMLAPAKADPALLGRINAEVVAILTLPEVRERLAAVGAEPEAQTPAAFAAFINADVAKWARLIKEIETRGAGPEGAPKR